DVRLPFQAVDAVRFGFFHGADTVKVLVTDHFAAHETPGQVGMNLGRSLDRVRALRDRPGPALVLADGEEDDLSHAGINVPQHRLAGEAAQTEVLHEDLAILFRQLV